MKLLRIFGVVAVVLLAVAGIGYMSRAWIFMHLAAWMAPKPEAFHEVTWAEGPKTAQPGDRPPNIVFILVDDMGFNDITLNGGGVAGGLVPTPNINSIAHDGATLTNGYAGNATCAPSRAAIMTGRYPERFGFEFTPTPVGFSRLVGTFRSPGAKHPPQFSADQVKNMPPGSAGMSAAASNALSVPASEITIAEVLKTKGYHTVHFGKWHLGAAKGSRPEEQGFDESLGFIAGASLYDEVNSPNVENSKQDFDPIDKFEWAVLPFAVQFNGSKPFHPNAYMTDYLTTEAIRSIDANKNRPFFIYLAYNGIHTPLQAPKADYDALSSIKDHRERVYGAMVRNLDRNVGRVLQALKDRGLDKNTLVIFTSDNGGAHYVGLPDLNKPYRGWKATFFEGGVHVPFFMRWPGVIPAGETYASPVNHIDIFATAAGAAGAVTPTDRPIDGINLIPYLTGKLTTRPHEMLFWRSGRYRMVRAGDWKLQVLPEPNKVWLFDLASDPYEHHNLADSNPAKVKELLAMLDKQDTIFVKPMWPSLLHGAIPIDHPLDSPDKDGDEYVYWDN